MTRVRNLLLVLGIVGFLSGCMSLEPAHMVPYEQMGIPKESAIKSLSVDKVSFAQDSYIKEKENAIEIKEALTSTLRSYRLLNSSSKKLLSANFKIKNISKLSDWGDITIDCDAVYAISDNGKAAQEIRITTQHITKLNRSDMWKGALVAGITAGVAANVKSNTGSNSKAIFSGAAAGLAAAALTDLQNQRSAKAEDMPEPGLRLTEQEMQQLDQIAFAKEGTPITALDANQRLQIAIENTIRKNFAMFIVKTLNSEIDL